MKRMSLVIPAFNEAALLPRLLDTIDAARTRFVHGPDAVEVIVADNSSTDTTVAIATARDCRVASVSKRMIASARNGGAALATAPILCFTDADMQIHPDSFNAIERALADPKIIGGATGVTMERWSAGIAATYALRVAWMFVRNHGMPAALGEFTTAIKWFAAAKGAHGLYHETITWAFLLIIAERLARKPADTWDAFAADNTDLLSWKPSILDRYYSKELLDSALARQTFVMPDRLNVEAGL